MIRSWTRAPARRRARRHWRGCRGRLHGRLGCLDASGAGRCCGGCLADAAECRARGARAGCETENGPRIIDLPGTMQAIRRGDALCPRHRLHLASAIVDIGSQVQRGRHAGGDRGAGPRPATGAGARATGADAGGAACRRRPAVRSPTSPTSAPRSWWSRAGAAVSRATPTARTSSPRLQAFVWPRPTSWPSRRR